MDLKIMMIFGGRKLVLLWKMIIIVISQRFKTVCWAELTDC